MTAVEEVSRSWRLLDLKKRKEHEDFHCRALPDYSIPAGEPMLALDRQDRRTLLLPIMQFAPADSMVNDGQWIFSQLDLEVLGQISPVLCLTCCDESLHEVFTVLAADILEALRAALPGEEAVVCRRLLDGWRNLPTPEAGIADEQKAAGLFGELWFVSQLLALNPAAIERWKGPLRQRHDFRGTRVAAEVKSTLGRERRHVIHGLDQLRPPPGLALFLVSIRLTRGSPAEATIQDLLNKVIAVARPSELARRISERVFTSAMAAEALLHYRFDVRDVLVLPVQDGFPRLTSDSLDTASLGRVSDVTYTLDLAELDGINSVELSSLLSDLAQS